MKRPAQVCDVDYVCSPRLASRLSTYAQTMFPRSSPQRKTFPSPCNARSLSMIIHRPLSQIAIPFFSLGCLAAIVDYSAFDHALARLWLGYRRDISLHWNALPGPNSRWISCRAEGGHKVHYDLLTGQLLINGKPLGRLPQEIAGHPTYASVLGIVSSQLLRPFCPF